MMLKRMLYGALEHGKFAFGSPEPIKQCPGDSEPEISFRVPHHITM